MLHFLARLTALLILVFGAPAGWAQAPAPAAKKPAAASPAARPAGPTSIEAEKIEGISELEVTARGKVELKRDDINVFSDFLRYNQEFGRIEADGGVRLERGADRFFGPRLRYDTVNETGVFEEPTFILNRRQSARGAAERLEFFGRNRMLLNRATTPAARPARKTGASRRASWSSTTRPRPAPRAMSGCASST